MFLEFLIKENPLEKKELVKGEGKDPFLSLLQNGPNASLVSLI